MTATTITVDCAGDLGPLDHFWRSTGFTPASLLLDRRMEQTLTYVGAVANQGIEHVRIHYLLDLVSAKGLGTDDVIYDWSDLDRGFDLLRQNRLKPFIELMGNPAGWFSDFNDEGQLQAWRRLVHDLALHLEERYGQEEVRTWWFECWNEPDVGWWPQFKARDWGALNHYFTASVVGLHEADPDLRIGGPGTAFPLSAAWKAFVAHCDSGENRFTGARGLDIAFTSTHVKAGFANGDFPAPDTAMAFARKRDEIAYLREHHPRLAALPVIDDECDPMVGWRDPMPWRPRPYNAAILSRILDGHLRLVRDRDGTDFVLLSNDNGFLGPWCYRTQLATIGPEDAQAAGRFELIKKPSLTIMSLWSLLGDRRLATDLPPHALPELGALASRRSGPDGHNQVAVLVYHSRDDFMTSGEGQVRFRLTGLAEPDWTLVHYQLSDRLPYAHRVWMQQGQPVRPDDDQLAAIRAAQEPQLVEEPRAVTATAGTIDLAFDLPLHGVSLVLLTHKPTHGPGSVTGLRSDRYHGTTQRQQVLLAWDHVGSRNLRTYEVAFAPAGGGFAPVPMPDQIDSCFLHVREAQPAGRYRVRAVDYWGRAGRWSETIEA